MEEGRQGVTGGSVGLQRPTFLLSVIPLEHHCCIGGGYTSRYPKVSEVFLSGCHSTDLEPRNLNFRCVICLTLMEVLRGP